MEIKRINSEKDLNLPNQPFEIFGKLLVNRIDNKWTYTEEIFNEVELQTFPDENYLLEDVDEKGFAIGAYEDDICIGIAIFENQWHKYLYVMDLKVDSDYRGIGIASALIREGRKRAEDLGYKGLYTVGQDNNLAACRFYLKTGFQIGGFNDRDYDFTQQEGKADIYFYLS